MSSKELLDMRKHNSRRFPLAAAVMFMPAMVAGIARAHVVLAEPDAAPGTRYVGHFKVSHGCSGSPTVALSIAIPPGVTDVAPEVPAGWRVSIVRQNGRIAAVTWEGGMVAADTPGVFAVAMTLPDREGALTFPATQTCEAGTEHWSEVGVDNSKRPAPTLRLATQAGVPSALEVSDGWFRMLPLSVPSGAYFTLRNTGTKAATLTGADSPACGMLMIHQSGNHAGTSAMMEMAAVAVQPGAQVRFAPGGYHLMCMNARPVLKLGARVPVTLHFRDAAPVTALFEVRDAAGE